MNLRNALNVGSKGTDGGGYTLGRLTLKAVPVLG